MPIKEEEIDGLSGLLFPFYDADTHMLYLAGKVRNTWAEDPILSTILSIYLEIRYHPQNVNVMD